MRAAVWVLPVPGPPATIVVHSVAATAAATRCRSGGRRRVCGSARRRKSSARTRGDVRGVDRRP